MKLFLVMLFTVSSAFASTGDVLLTCTDTSFQDLEKIVITQDEDNAVYVTETDSNNKSVTAKYAVADIDTKDGIVLSDWNGYSRRLYNDGKDNSSYAISTSDECTTSISKVTCK
jgi:hypothetical protein